MEVTFTRTGERRYRVDVRRDRACPLLMDPAPGFDLLLPHDLVHFVVESEWEIHSGIFGQLAAGGDAGTFRPLRTAELRKQRAVGKRLRIVGRSDTGRSERLAHLAAVACRKRRGVPVNPWDLEVVHRASDIDPGTLERVLARLDELADRWRSLGVGGSITLTWPWPERRPLPSARSKRRAEPARRPRTPGPGR